MSNPKKGPLIKVGKDGPYEVSGKVPLDRENIILGSDGEPERWEKRESVRPPSGRTYLLCRCGASKNKPFCDGGHVQAAFDGTETAERAGFIERAERTIGPGVDLTWSAEICAAARFCHAGEEAWGYAERSGDPAARAEAVRQACCCPSGSLTAWNKEDGAAIEPELEPSIGLIEGCKDGTSGPIWVKGGIPLVSAEGIPYEARNRATLCRCGKSGNKPFCDGTHVLVGFKSGV